MANFRVPIPYQADVDAPSPEARGASLTAQDQQSNSALGCAWAMNAHDAAAWLERNQEQLPSTEPVHLSCPQMSP